MKKQLSLIMILLSISMVAATTLYAGETETFQSEQYEYYEKHPEVKEKIRQTLKRKYKSGEIIPPMLGEHHTEKTKRKQRLVKLGKKNPKCSETRKRLCKEKKI